MMLKRLTNTYWCWYNVININWCRGGNMKQRYFNYKVMQNYIKENNLTIKKFCDMSNITYYQYRQIVKDDLNVFISVLYKVARTLKIPFSEMFKVED